MGKASLQHWFDATPAWKCTRNCLTQPCHEFRQGSCGTSVSKLDSCADDGPAALRLSHLVTTHNYLIMIGGGTGGLHVEMAGRVVEWFWVAVQSQLLEQCCKIFCESILSCEDKTCPPGYRCDAAYSAADCLPFLCGVWAWSCCQLRAVTPQMEIEQPALVLEIQLCILRRMHWVRCGDCNPWNVQAFCFGPCELWDVKLSARSALSAVEHFLCGKQNRGKCVPTFVDYLPQALEDATASK